MPTTFVPAGNLSQDFCSTLTPACTFTRFIVVEATAEEYETWRQGFHADGWMIVRKDKPEGAKVKTFVVVQGALYSHDAF